MTKEEKLAQLDKEFSEKVKEVESKYPYKTLGVEIEYCQSLEKKQHGFILRCPKIADEHTFWEEDDVWSLGKKGIIKDRYEKRFNCEIEVKEGQSLYKTTWYIVTLIGIKKEIENEKTEIA